MSEYWCMRTDRSQKEFIWHELQQGRLRQGWGYDPGLDLRLLRDKRNEGNDLDPEESRAWKGNRRLLPDEPDGITSGDLIFLPNLPSEQQWTLVEVVNNEYDYSIAERHGDYGHIRYVRIVSPEPIHPYSPHVSARLRGTMRTQSRLWSANRYGDEIASLLQAIEGGKPLDTVASEDDHIAKMHEAVRASLWKQLSFRFRGEDFEGPVKRVLEQVYNGDVEHRGGRGEKGADLICNFVDDLGIPYSVAVQVKMWSGEGDVSGAFDQLRTASAEYNHVAACVVLTTLESLHPGTEAKKAELEGELDRPVVVLMRDEVLDLFLRHMPDVVGSTESGPATSGHDE